MVLLRKSNPQNVNLQTAAELGVKQNQVMDIEQVSEILRKARNIFEEQGVKIDPVCFKRFPHGSCGPASDILGKWLSENGVEGLRHVSGWRNQKPHAWLEYKGCILDITSDQFEDGCAPVFVGENSKFHSSFENQRKSELGFAKRLSDAYRKFSEAMKNA